MPTIPPTPASIVGAPPAEFEVAAALLDFVGVPDSAVLEISFVAVVRSEVPEALVVISRVVLPVSRAVAVPVPVLVLLVGRMRMLLVPLIVFTEYLLVVSMVVSVGAVGGGKILARVEVVVERNVSQLSSFGDVGVRE